MKKFKLDRLNKIKERLLSKWTIQWNIKVKTFKCIMSTLLMVGGTGLFIWNCFKPGEPQVDIMAAGGIMFVVGFFFRPRLDKL